MRLVRMTLTEVSGASCESTITVASPSSTERDFVLAHVEALNPTRGVRTTFLSTSGVPQALTGMLSASSAGFETTAEALSQRLHRTMRSKARTTPCILAIVSLASAAAGAADSVAVLKLDMDNAGALAERDASGRVTSLTMLTKLLPQPGKLAKALLWPDPRGGTGAYLRDMLSGEPAAYFPEAFDLEVGTTPERAERAIAEVLLSEPDLTRRAAGRAAMEAYDGTVGGALAELRRARVTVPGTLPPDLQDAEIPVRAQSTRQRRVQLQADWLKVTVPLEHEPDVVVTDNQDGTWTVSATVSSVPHRTVLP